MAEAGPDLLSGSLGQVGLDGTLSSGGALSYAWASIGLTGDGTAGSLDDPLLAQPTISLNIRQARFTDVISSSPVFHFKRSDTGGLCQFDTRLPADVAGADPNEAISITIQARGQQPVGGQQFWSGKLKIKTSTPGLFAWRMKVGPTWVNTACRAGYHSISPRRISDQTI